MTGRPFADVELPDDVSSGSSDRELFAAIWFADEVGDLDPMDAWAILAARYPANAAIAVAVAYHRCAGPRVAEDDDGWLRLAERIAALDAPAELGPIADVLALIASELRSPAARIRMKRLAPVAGDDDERHDRLAKFARQLVRAADAKTAGGKRYA